jgi:preprotein translocase subunit SecE
MARTSPAQFVSQVRAEIGKVVWPTRREVALTSLMVFLLAMLAAIFFGLVDMAIRFGLTSTLNFFGS